MAAVQGYVDATLGEASVNTCYEVDADAGVRRQADGHRGRARHHGLSRAGRSVGPSARPPTLDGPWLTPITSRRRPTTG